MSGNHRCPQCGKECDGLRGLSLHRRFMHSGHDYSLERSIQSLGRKMPKATPERLRKLSEASKRRWQNPEFRARMGEIAKERWTPELREIMSRKTGERMRRPEWRIKNSERAARIFGSAEQRQKASERMYQRLQSGSIKNIRAKWYTYETLGGTTIRLCGTYELRTARALDKFGYRWKKNSDRFRYKDLSGNWHWYTPDFKILGSTDWFYVDTKGFLDAASFVKFSDLEIYFPAKLYIIFVEGIELIEQGDDPFTPVAEFTAVLGTENKKYARA